MAKKKTEKPKTEDVNNNALPIKKPAAFSLSKFRSTRTETAGVDNVTNGMPHMKIGEVKDFFRTHPSEEFWSDELCFAMVPTKGQQRDTLHLIDESLAVEYLPKGRILRFRLVLATKPFDVMFLLHCPTVNLDNAWNATAEAACEQAKTIWTQVVSRKDEGIESYAIGQARNQAAFPDPAWPKTSLEELIGKVFAGRIIEEVEHPALLRLIGEKQDLK